MRNFIIPFITAVVSVFSALNLWATGEPSTYFNIYVPPNNDAVQRNVCLVVTAIFDSTSFTITDDAMDGDSDDSKTGILMAGESYVLYIKDNGINDDAQYASGGTLKRDGDYFIIESNKNVYASQSTNSDWQHDWVPGISQSSLSTKFILYAPKGTSSKRDINAMAYEDSTMVTLRRISTASTIVTGFTNVDYQGGTAVFQRLLNRGQDLIHFYSDARNILDDGHTYVIEASKPITLQYGALFGNERDGGGYVPTNTGSSSGELAYFVVPYQAVGEQEIRVVSWDPDNTVTLFRFSAGSWIQVQNWNMGAKTVKEWVGKNNGNVSYATVWKLVCSPGKRFSVFEGNWFETGSVGTSDMATMVSAENGTTSGTYFLTYMAPPGNQANVMNPFTNTMFGGKFSHLYLFAQDSANVVVKDAYSNGADFTRSFTIAPGRYADCALSELQWKAIYNGTGTIAGGAERPYLVVESDSPISVMNTNFNDNWMMYFGSSQLQKFAQNTVSSQTEVIPGESVTVTSNISVNGTSPVTDVNSEVIVEGGLKIISSEFVDVTNNQSIAGVVVQSENASKANFDNLPDLSPSGQYKIVTELTGSVTDANGTPITQMSVSEVTVVVNGEADNRPQQSIGIESVTTNVFNTQNLIFDFAENTGLENVLTDSWTCSTIDYDGDGDDDLFFTDRIATQSNKLFRNNGNCTFTQVTIGAIVTDKAKSIASSWADFDNDGDMDVVVANNTMKPNFFYINNGNGTFTKNTTAGFVQEVGYYHHVSWVDVNNDGQLELYLGNYWPTKFNELWRRNSLNEWELWQDNLLSQIPGSGVGSTWSDINNDGYQDLLILNNSDENNRMYINRGDGNFDEVQNAVTSKGGNSVASSWGDIDNDGDLDLFISNASNMNNELFFNNGDGTFTEVTSGPVVSMGGHSHGSAFADFDQDGDLDLYISNDQGVKFLYLNNGQGVFTSKGDEWPGANFGKGYGVSISDVDADGDVDMINATHSNQRNFVFRANDGYNSNNWLSLRLTGNVSNASAVGARINLHMGNSIQTREINAQNGLGGQNSLRQSFGLGTASSIDSLVISWPSGYRQVLNNVAPNQHLHVLEPEGARVVAKIYLDQNNNCLKDADEVYVSNVHFGFDNNAYLGYSNSEGEVIAFLGLGDHSIKLNDDRFKSECNLPHDFNVDAIGTDKSIGEFGIQPLCQDADLAVTAMTTVMRRGFSSKYIIQVTNNGAETAQNVMIAATIPVTIVVDSATAQYNTIPVSGNNSRYEFAMPDLALGETQLIELYYTVSLGVMPGDFVSSTFEINSDSHDCISNDNTITDVQEIFGSFDPNDILVSPLGYTEHHYISPKQEMTYRIRFQNVGNYKAEFVTITDTLPEYLNPSTIQKIVSSHQHTFSIAGRILTVRFDNINLPDSASNPEGSNGFIQFSILQKDNNPAGTVIRNSASIVFDYNEPLHTNQVFNTVMSEDELFNDGVLIIFPNPTTGPSFLKAKSIDGSIPDLREIKIYDMRGMLIYFESPEGNMPKIDFTNFRSGQYLVVAYDYLGSTYKGMLLVTKQ